MPRFIVGHATHPQWQRALALAATQIDAQLDTLARAKDGAPMEPTLGLVYFSDHYAAHAQALWSALHERWPGLSWSGAVGVGVAAGGIEYFDAPALALMVMPLPRSRFRVFSGAQPLGDFEPATALVHADAQAPDLPELIDDLAGRMRSGWLFGGVAASRTRRWQIADGAFEGGLSGVAFSGDVGIVSRVTQGCQPVGAMRRITACERSIVLQLDGRPALDTLLDDLGLDHDEPRSAARALRGVLAGLAAPGAALPWTSQGEAGPRRHRAFGGDVLVRHLIGIDPVRRGVAVAEQLETGMTLAFCQRDREAARRDLVRICAEIRDELSPEVLPQPAALAAGSPVRADATAFDPADRIAGAIYISCAGRGGPHFGAPSAELQIVRHALGDVPLVGFFAAGEIGHHHLYGYTGILTVFTRSR
jgi:small ligand-binding sensory domain FIST